ncbi:ammonia-forming cytochrome c nitrite reductase subunit c552 [Candidatus Saganbacteria bacterium]|nr:ammonia-forming cytochrome c nitrite reductase subunit c552 [Candidatus Saganbacteria bacterium]
MRKIFSVVILVLAAFCFPALSQEAIDQKSCFTCHSEIKNLWSQGKHKTAGLPCADCHGNLQKHLVASGNKPETKLDPNNCGRCHANQFESFFKVNLKKTARDEKSQLTGRAPNPFWDKLMMGHGFTKEHNSPRSHAYMLIDHLVVDRSYGGRFQPKDGFQYVTAKTPVKTWDLLENKYPGTSENKAFLPETAPAANPTCLQCKTSDSILKWKYMGEKDPRAKWDRTSNVVEYAQDLQNVVGCIQCHDPHATKPRIVRDALIQALTRKEKDTLWHKDEGKTGIKVVDFRDFRKIAILDKYDAKLQCGQCHVEYNCNPGIDLKSGGKVGFEDIRTNHFPLKDVFNIYEHYNKLGFRDFMHTLTGGLLFKAQHPETEVFWNSRHDKAGVNCNDCHMPRVKGKNGQEFTSHWQTSPRNYIKETCLKCHSEWTPQEAVYAIDSIKNHVRGKMRKAEFWLGNLIDKIVEAKKINVDAETIAKAQEQHQKAHILWEWWTAENSDGFHNPDQAKASLTKSVEEAKKGIELLNKAMAR